MKKKIIVIQFFSIMAILIISNSSNLKAYNVEFDSTNQTMNKNDNNMALDISNLVFELDSNPFNIPYSDWTAKWWQWAYSIPKNIHPAYDNTGKFCHVNQKEPVWFFPGTYEHPVIRHCEIPKDVGLLFPILNSECSFAEFAEMKTKDELSNCAKKIQDTTVPEFVTLNGIEIPNLEKYRIQSDLFKFTLPENNILDLPKGTTEAISDGYWMFLKPLPPGDYELKFKGNLKPINDRTKDSKTDEEFAGPVGWNYTSTYLLTIK
ncbi:MAG: hypothetical protein R3321_01235 [Nitrososphaeraceae archaeon]|nr:hypothetical protein [Nitrososphaeraceae archaeon]